MQRLCDDLAAEHADLDAIVADLDERSWEHPTPARGWAVRDQISHLGYFDRTAVLAVTEPVAFSATVAALLAGGVDPSVEPGRAMGPAELLAWWRDGRAQLLGVLRPLDPATRISWYGPPMGARSFATARLMETWAHGQDVADALQVVRSPTDRLRHVAHLGVRARPFSYLNRGLEPPAEPVSVILTAPSGETWEWDGGAPDSVSGPALDFCLVVTQRRHPADTALDIVGGRAVEWMEIAQAFAGPAGPGRPAGQVTGR
ncbi:MAG TPA: TIGR03084 family metal-binding protein [Acidimicrobiales bacterium]|nr:TIGR03084 family metal-binding protein [Acidimicrobiales bacterium]